MCKDESTDLKQTLVNAVLDYARKHWLVYLVFDHPYPDRGLSLILNRKGFGFHPKGIPPSGLIRATLLLDLEQETEILRGRFFPSVRRKIRKAERSGLVFSIGSIEDVKRFRDLMLAICRRRNSNPTPPYPDFFQRLWEAMEPCGFVRLFVVRFGVETVSAAVVSTVGDIVRVWKVGWSGAHAEKHPNDFMWWSIIRWAKERRFRALDFVWVDEEDATAVARGERNPEAFRDGATFFKLGFGGRLVTVPPPQSRFFHPVLVPLTLP